MGRPGAFLRGTRKAYRAPAPRKQGGAGPDGSAGRQQQGTDGSRGAWRTPSPCGHSLTRGRAGGVPPPSSRARPQTTRTAVQVPGQCAATRRTRHRGVCRGARCDARGPLRRRPGAWAVLPHREPGGDGQRGPRQGRSSVQTDRAQEGHLVSRGCGAQNIAPDEPAVPGVPPTPLRRVSARTTRNIRRRSETSCPTHSTAHMHAPR